MRIAGVLYWGIGFRCIVRVYLGFVVAVAPANCKVMGSNPWGVKFREKLKLAKSRNWVFLNVALGCLF